MFLALISGVRGGGRDRERDDERDQQRERDDEDGRRTGARLHDELAEKMQTMTLNEDEYKLLERMGAMSLRSRPTFDLEVEHNGETKIIPVYATLYIDNREGIKEAIVRILADIDSPYYEDDGGLEIYHKSWFSEETGYDTDTFKEDDFKNGWHIVDDGSGAFTHTSVSARQGNGWSTPGPIPPDYDALLKMYPETFTQLSPDGELGGMINKVLKQLAGRLKLWSKYPRST